MPARRTILVRKRKICLFCFHWSQLLSRVQKHKMSQSRTYLENMKVMWALHQITLQIPNSFKFLLVAYKALEISWYCLYINIGKRQHVDFLRKCVLHFLCVEVHWIFFMSSILTALTRKYLFCFRNIMLDNWYLPCLAVGSSVGSFSVFLFVTVDSAWLNEKSGLISFLIQQNWMFSLSMFTFGDISFLLRLWTLRVTSI